MAIKSDHTPQVHSYLSLRKAVGWIGILLPFVLVAGHLIIFNGASALTNMSAYYHTGMRDLFVGAICAIALFLFFYKGYDRWDNSAANLAGFFALGVAFFPTVKEGPWDWIAWVHFSCAACFLVILALISIFLFTRGEEHLTEMKKKRNLIFRACGIIMLVALASIEVFFLFFDGINSDSRFVLIAETVTLMAFGISWLTKGGTLYPDKPIKKSNMENEEKLIKVFIGPEPTALLLMKRLEEIGVKSLIKNDSTLGYLGGNPVNVDLYILEDDMYKAAPLIDEFRENEEIQSD
ncbi:MAG: hypothetical protein H6545_01070 [Bacteroidales bacterium]|nr:hypothetical protein [Bacteroidales bacterium]MCB9027698.1 hypothetical protein [Bacteroidales bacterium]HNT92334.1 hypothetical protein [Bacteroidales bacterium]HOO65517.1 hypothetical protein [Bacteroidales bacterium]HPJ04111.1 hypothetical protein [Bacteroidales bacterium]